MSPLLQQAFEAAKTLSVEEQDAIAGLILGWVGGLDEEAYELTPAQVAEVDRIVTGIDDGTIELVGHAEIDAFWSTRGFGRRGQS